MKTRVSYECEICGYHSDNREEILRCENRGRTRPRFRKGQEASFNLMVNKSGTIVYGLRGKIFMILPQPELGTHKRAYIVILKPKFLRVIRKYEDNYILHPEWDISRPRDILLMEDSILKAS